MKIIIFFSTLVFLPFLGNTQESNEDLVLFSKGNALYSLVEEEFSIEKKEEVLLLALDYFKELISKYPKSNLIYRAINNAALTCEQLGYTEEALEYYKKIISSKANDKEKGGVGQGIMADPYTLYKNRACKRMAEIYLLKKEFDLALKYINLTKKYPYKHFCGNAYATNDIYIATLYTKGHYGLNQIEKALSYSLPHIFSNGLTNNSSLVDLTVKILKEQNNEQKLIEDFKKSIENYYYQIDKKKRHKRTRYYIDFMEVKIEFFPEIFSLTTYQGKERNNIKIHLEKSYFYTVLTQHF